LRVKKSKRKDIIKLINEGDVLMPLEIIRNDIIKGYKLPAKIDNITNPEALY